MSDGCQNYDKGQMGPRVVRVPPKPYNYPPCQICGCKSHFAYEPNEACIAYLKAQHSALLAVADAAEMALKSCLDWMEFTIPNLPTLNSKCPHCKGPVPIHSMNYGGPINKARTALELIATLRESGKDAR